MQVRMFNPTTMAHAANLAKLHESSRATLPKAPSQFGSSWSKPAASNTKHTSSQTTQNTSTETTTLPKPIFNRTTKTLSTAEMAEHREKGLCMFCDEAFIPSHHLKHRKHRFMMMEMEDESDSDHTDPSPDPSTTSDTLSQPDTPQLSLQALIGTPNFQTMRVTGMHNKKLIHILLDSGSAHNFLDLDLAKKLGCKLEVVTPMNITG